MPNDKGYAYYEDVNWGLLRLWGGRKGLDVLDVGCGFATTSERIQSLGNRVTGVELSPEALPVARKRLEHVLAADLQDLDSVSRELGDTKFDVIVFADVLEHLAWPQSILEAYLVFLKPSGRVLISLPNVALWSVRLSHLFGRWNYQDTGVLDRTHLRFFTRGTARKLIESAGLGIRAGTQTPGLVRPFIPLVKRLLAPSKVGGNHDPAALLNSRLYKIYLRLVYPLERAVAAVWPGGLAFQVIFEAERK